MTRQHPGLHLGLLVLYEALAVVGLTRLGRETRWQVDWAHFWSWLQGAPTGDAVAGLLRWAMLVVAWWLLVSSALYILARLSRVPALVRGTGWLTVPFVRFAVDRALVVTLAASTVVGARGGVAFAQSSPAPPVARTVASASPAPGWDGSAVATPEDPALQSSRFQAEATPGRLTETSPPLAPAGQCEVVVDDNLWSIAAAHLAEVSGRDVSTLEADEIAPYWWGLVDANRPTLRSGHPNLIYPGEVVVLPAVVAAGEEPVPGSTSAVSPAPSASTDASPGSATQPLPTTAPTASPTTNAPAASSTTVAPTSTTTTMAAGLLGGATPGPAAAPSTTGPRPPGPADEPGRKGEVVTANPWALRVALAAAVGLPVFALAGWLSKLRRGRVNQASRARPGRDVVRTEPELEPIERAARVIVADQAEEWIDAAMRGLSAALGESSLASVPTVRCVRAGEMGVEVLLAEPFTDAPHGWEVGDGGHVWRVSPDVELDELRRQGADHVAFTPALVSLGATPEGPILADLEGFGALSVEGDPSRVRAFLAGAALELHSASWAQGVQLRVYGLDGFEGLDGVLVDDGAELVAEATRTARFVADGFGTGPGVAASRSGRGEPCYPLVVVVGPEADAGVVEELEDVARRGAGVAVAGAGPLASAPWQLVVGPDGTAVLKPLGLDVRMAGLPASVPGTQANGNGLVRGPEVGGPTDPSPGPPAPPILVVDQDGLDESAIAGAVNAMATVADLHDLEPSTPIPGSPKPPRPLRRREDCEVWVSVLRRTPEVTGWALESPRGRRKLVEVFVYLAVFGAERPIPGSELRTNCWAPELVPGSNGDRPRLREVTPEAFHQAMSRLRKQLGEGSRGWHLPLAENSAYSIGAGVGCDWTLFRGLVDAAELAARNDPSEALALYREALELIGGDPFVDVSPGYCTWADNEQLVTDIRLAVAKAAHDAATLALPSDPELAVWATQQGLLVLPTQLELFDVQMLASTEMGDAAGLRRSLQAKCWAHEQVDPDGGVPPETMEFHRHLQAKLASRNATAGVATASNGASD